MYSTYLVGYVTDTNLPMDREITTAPEVLGVVTYTRSVGKKPSCILELARSWGA